MGSILLVAFGVLTVFAVVKAEGLKWKIWNLVIIFSSAALGLLVGYLLGLWSKNMELGGYVAMDIALLGGTLASLICIRKNPDHYTRAESGT